MKQNFLHKLWIVALISLAGCKQGEFAEINIEEYQPISISVSDGGYVSEAASSESATRAIDNKYSKDFTAGDVCGLYIVRDGKVIADNVRLIADNVDGAITWRTENGTSLSGGLPGEVYYLYFPYQNDITDKIDVSAKDDAGFFEELIRTWNVNSDQSDYASGYSASDLMTASGIIEEVGDVLSLSFTMKHRMSLSVIEVPLTIYNFTDFPEISYSEGASDIDFESNFKPYSYNGVYLYILNPFLSSNVKFDLIYYNGRNVELSINISGSTIPEGQFKTFIIDGGIQQRNCTYAESGVTRIGDFYCTKDGGQTGYLMPKEADSETLKSENVVGIVFQTDRKRLGLKEKLKLAEKGIDKPHGLVMALKNAAEGKNWSSVLRAETIMNCTSKHKTYIDINGYWNYFETYAYYEPDNYQAFKEAVNYINSCPVPDNTTGWYLPSSGQWWDILQNLGGSEKLALETEQNSPSEDNFYWQEQSNISSNLNKWIETVESDKKHIFEGTEFFWSSSEYNDSNAIYWCISGNSIYCNNVYKWLTGFSDININIKVRPVLAF